MNKNYKEYINKHTKSLIQNTIEINKYINATSINY